jgi:F-type H+-transporting ATPase subunit b
MNINATLLGQTIAFVIFVAICWKYVWPPIISIMEEREKRIADGLEAAKKADDSLEEAQLEFDQKMTKEEAAEILNKANTRASQIVANASIKAEAEAEKILSAASKTIENDANKAKEELKQKMSELIIDTSEKILEEEIDPDKHQNLLKKAASEL